MGSRRKQRIAARAATAAVAVTSLIAAAAANGWIDLRSAVCESLIGIRRAGADIVLTYWAAEVSGWLM